jgi:hypothetical protein
MKRWTLALTTFALGAGAVYFLDPELGPQRRARIADTLSQWAHDARMRFGGQGGEAESGPGPAARLRDWASRWRSKPTLPDDGLEPLSMTPPGLQDAATQRVRQVRTAVAVAAPLAVAVGTVLWRRNANGDWLH